MPDNPHFMLRLCFSIYVLVPITIMRIAEVQADLGLIFGRSSFR
jgi:hypothetical protein